MDDVLNFNGLQSMIQMLGKMYDSVRVVDPIKKKLVILSQQDESLNFSNVECYSLWHKGNSCSNCVSARAFNEDKAIVKIEYDQGRVLMINAFPMVLEEQRIVIEMFKDITESGIINIKSSISDAGRIESVIKRRNKAIVQDDLTKVYNKRFIYERLPFEIVQSHTNNTPLTVIMADIDDFKKVNDTYGHIAGDYVLKGFAKILNKYIRKNLDWVSRFGGDEFFVVLGETDIIHGHQVGERMRKKVAGTTITYEGQQIHITGSFGVYSLSDEQITSEKLIERADQQLYKSKEDGKNKVSFNHFLE